MKCKKCGSDIRPNTKFCMKCGTPVNQCDVGGSKRKKGKKLIGVVIFIIVVAVALLCKLFLNNDFNKEAVQEESTEKNENTAEESQKPQELVTEENITEENTESIAELSKNTTSFGQILSDSSEFQLSDGALASLHKNELKVARNEIYARHGIRFKDKDLQNYFNDRDWYEGTVDTDDFNEDELNDVEKYNILKIKDWEDNGNQYRGACKEWYKDDVEYCNQNTGYILKIGYHDDGTLDVIINDNIEFTTEVDTSFDGYADNFYYSLGDGAGMSYYPYHHNEVTIDAPSQSQYSGPYLPQ